MTRDDHVLSITHLRTFYHSPQGNTDDEAEESEVDKVEINAFVLYFLSQEKRLLDK